jgi:hypothetical protein
MRPLTTTGVAVLSVLGVLAESPPARFARGHADPAATTGTAGIEELREARSREPGGWRRGRTSRRNLMHVIWLKDKKLVHNSTLIRFALCLPLLSFLLPLLLAATMQKATLRLEDNYRSANRDA